MAAFQSLNFNPTSISGCQLWLDSADSSTVLLSGANVSTWRDKSGNSRNAVYSLSNFASRSSSNSGIYFSNSYYTTTYTADVTNETLFIAFRSASPSNRIMLSSPNPNGRFVGIPDGGITPTYSVGFGKDSVTWGATVPITSNANVLTTVQFSSGSFSRISANGGSYSNYTALTFNSGSNTNIGGVLSGGSVIIPYVGVIYEIIAYNSVLSATITQSVEGYLAWKWGIQGSLPTTHPFYNIAPNSANLPYPVNIPVPVPSQAFSLSTNPLVFFNPTTVPGCQFWLDGLDSSRFTLSGTTVNAWLDKSGNGNTFSRVSGSPSYSSNSVLFLSANSDLLRTAASFIFSATNSVIFYVAQVIPNGNFLDIISFPEVSGRSIRYGGAGGLVGTTSFGGDNNDFANNNYYINGSLNPATTTSIYTVPHLISAINVNVVGNTRVQLSDDFFSRFFNGRIYEVLFYNLGVTTNQRQQVEGYLAWKWALQSTLPSNHPFRNSPPGLSANLALSLGRFQGTSFSPRSISGIQLWLDGNDPNGNGVVPASGASVGTWVDKSGAGNNATSGTSPTFLSSAINNLGVLSFNGSTQFLSSTDLYSNRSFSVFLIIRRQGANNSGSNGMIGGSSLSTNQNMIILFSSGTTLRFAFFNNDLDYPSFPAYTGNTATEPSFLIEFTYTPGTRIIFVNGIQVALDGNTSNLSSSLGMRIGSWLGTPSSSLNFNGFIGEIIVLNGTPNLGSRQSIEGYLAWKWGLQGSLPSNHPFRNFSPPPN